MQRGNISAGFIDLFINTDDDSVIARHCWGFKTLFPVNTAWKEKHYEFQDWTGPLFTLLAIQMLAWATSQLQKLSSAKVQNK